LINSSRHDARGMVVSNPGDLYYGLMLALNTASWVLLTLKWLIHSLHVGGGYTFFGDSSYGTLNPGAGLAFWFTDK
jgi:hypothetical protein